MRILLLGGTTEASALARALVGRDAVFSYAGRTADPAPQPLPTRTGGFGGVDGLRRYLEAEAITHVVDATHPFAAQMTRHAVEACAGSQIPLIGFERAAWQPGQGDRWTSVPDLDAAARCLPEAPAHVFLAIGKLGLAAFAARPDLRYLLRLVDPPDAVPLPRATVVVARGPFDADVDAALMRAHAVTHVVAKNAGGEGARAKLTAARRLGLPVVMVERPAQSARRLARSVAGVLDWLDRPDHADLGV